MKKVPFNLRNASQTACKASLSVVVMLSTFVQAAHADWTLPSYLGYLQHNRCGGTFNLTQNGKSVTGKMTHGFPASSGDAGNLVSEGRIVIGTLEGDKLKMIVQIDPIHHDGKEYFGGGQFTYTGTIDSLGMINGFVVDNRTPDRGMTWYGRTPATGSPPAVSTPVSTAPPPPPTPTTKLTTFKPFGRRPAGSAPIPNPVPSVDFNGVWETTTATGNKFTMILTQTDYQVKGTYSPRNGIISGKILPDGNMQYIWIQEDNGKKTSGSGIFKTAPGNATFQGWYSNSFANPQLQSGAWTGTKVSGAVADGGPGAPEAGAVMTGPGAVVTGPGAVAAGGPGAVMTGGPEVMTGGPGGGTGGAAPWVNFSGRWDTVTGIGNKFTMTLQQNGDQVTGTYTPHDGKINGKVDAEGKLTYFWTEPNASGAGIFRPNRENTMFEGSFSNNVSDPARPDGTWTGRRVQ